MKTFAVIILTLAFSSGAFDAKPTGDAAAGKDTFRQNCATCHGVDGTGNGPMTKALHLKPADLTSKRVQALSDADIEKTITHGKGDMKPIKDLTKVDIANLIAYVRSIAKK